MEKVVNDFSQNQDLVLNSCGFVDDKEDYDEFLGIGKKAKAKKAARKEARAEKALAKGKTAKADRLSARADQIRAKLAAKGYITPEEQAELDTAESEEVLMDDTMFDERSGDAGASSDSKKKLLLYGGIGSGVLIVGILVTALLIKKKK